MSTFTPVAIVSGASSGIGLALAQHLLSKDWAIVALDVQDPPADALLPSERALFIRCDVASWDSQAAAFKQAFQWRRRIDFAALNAGIDDRDDIFRAAAADLTEFPDDPPRKPNMQTFDVDLVGPYYGIKLFVHYYLRNEPVAAPASVAPPTTGCIILTASIAALYSQSNTPQYCAAKAGLVGLVRSLAPTALDVSGIRISAICPAFVPTNLAPPGVVDVWPVEATTPMKTIILAFDELMDEGKAWNGQVVEASGDTLTYHKAPAFPRRGAGDDQGVSMKEGLELFEKSYKARNLMFARLGASNQ